MAKSVSGNGPHHVNISWSFYTHKAQHVVACNINETIKQQQNNCKISILVYLALPTTATHSVPVNKVKSHAKTKTLLNPLRMFRVLKVKYKRQHQIFNCTK